jgi:hypothetical protein
MTTNSENQQNTLYAKGITFFPNPNLDPDGAFSTAVPLPGGGTGDAVHGEQIRGWRDLHPGADVHRRPFRVFPPALAPSSRCACATC